MTALEMQFAALRMARIARDAPRDQPVRLRAICELAALQLPQCEAFSWTSETASAVGLASHTVPASSVLSSSALLPVRAWWWYCVDALPVRSRHGITLPDGTHMPEDIVALSCAGVEDGMQVVAYRSLPHREPLASTAFHIPEGVTLASFIDQMRQRPGVSEQSAADLVQIARFIVAACTWLQQRIVVATSGHIERHRRKQIARDHRVPEPLDVKVIQLRRLESPSRVTTGSDPVTWSCRWVVNGHWRHQPYKAERKLIYIMPFMKGPADMPLKVATHTVYQVTR